MATPSRRPVPIWRRCAPARSADGDEWVINGQKLWTTTAHDSDWVWLAARTDPDAQPRHAGITVFLFSMHTPGVTIQQHTALSGEVSCTVFYDNVRVPDSARVGEVNGGWAVIVDALAGERITMGNIAAALHRQLDDLLDFVRRDPVRLVGPRGSAKRAVDHRPRGAGAGHPGAGHGRRAGQLDRYRCDVRRRDGRGDGG